ncbi:MAG: type IV pilus assembly protein PilM [Candidatus Omnitrophica bacterium]|nr:type IV pilus assembly protein PilM [Candidatus Omnitrophota bacterium]
MPAGSAAERLNAVAGLLRQLTTIRPKEAKLTVGLDLGSSAIKVIALGARKGLGARPIVSQNLQPFDPNGTSDPSGVIKTALAALKTPVHAVNLSVSGPWVIMRIVEMPAMKPAELRQALPFEAQRYLPFNLQDVVIDGVVLGPSDAKKHWVLIVACKKELIDRRIDWVKKAGYEVALIDVDALAVANGFLAVQGRQAGEHPVALVDIGAQLSNLVIFKGSSPYLVRDIPWGGEKLLRQVAEQLKKEVDAIRNELQQDQPDPQRTEALKAATEPLVTELQLSFDYFENRFGQPPDQVLISGGLAHLPGLVEALKSHLTQTVATWSPIKGLSSQYAVAYGLALRTN